MASDLKLTLNSQSSEIIEKFGQNGLKILLFDPSKEVELMSNMKLTSIPASIQLLVFH
jgi:hypothetical protein